MCEAEDFDGDKIEHVLLELMSFLFLFFVYSSLCFVAVTNSSAKSNLERK